MKTFGWLANIAQLVQKLTKDPKFAGSNPVNAGIGWENKDKIKIFGLPAVIQDIWVICY
jgi:hypothetical protein